jgi:NDP-sugar pyrophosphorylase family protein
LSPPPESVDIPYRIPVTYSMGRPAPKVVIALAGGVRQSAMSAALGRPVVDLPLPDGRSILQMWRDEVQDLGRALGGEMIPLRTLVSKPSALPKLVEPGTLVPVTVEYDKLDFRGTGGLLRDLAADFRPDDLMLVLHGNQVPLMPLTQMWSMLTSEQAAVTLMAEPDGTAAGIQLVQAGALEGVRDKGFIDFKEQALPAIAKQHRVRVVRSQTPVLQPIRTLDQYISTLRMLTLRASNNMHTVPETNAVTEEWTRTFALVDVKASVAKDAIVHDSVVLPGATIMGGGVVVRSIVSQGATVPAGARVFDSVFGTQGKSKEA